MLNLRSTKPRPPVRPLAIQAPVDETHAFAVLEAVELRYLERLLGHRPTGTDAAALPGIDLSGLGEDER